MNLDYPKQKERERAEEGAGEKSGTSGWDKVSGAEGEALPRVLGRHAEGSGGRGECLCMHECVLKAEDEREEGSHACLDA